MDVIEACFTKSTGPGPIASVPRRSAHQSHKRLRMLLPIGLVHVRTRHRFLGLSFRVGCDCHRRGDDPIRRSGIRDRGRRRRSDYTFGHGQFHRRPGSVRGEMPSRKRRAGPLISRRDSGVISEGAGILILENLEHAEARGAKPYLEISGYGTQRDLDVQKPASGLEFSMGLALANAGYGPDEISTTSPPTDPGHPLLDAIEVEIIKRVFGRRAYSLPVSSIKGVTGNALAAGGPFQVIACALEYPRPTASADGELRGRGSRV